jgi:hypothetical protein
MSSKSWQGYRREAKNSIRGLKDGGGWASTNNFSLCQHPLSFFYGTTLHFVYLQHRKRLGGSLCLKCCKQSNQECWHHLKLYCRQRKDLELQLLLAHKV